MTKYISHILFAIVTMTFVFGVSAQDKNPFGTNPAMPLRLNSVKGQLNQYGSSDQDHVTSLQLFGDSTFVYFNHWSDKFNFTLGQYSRRGNLLLLNWDSLKTLHVTADTSISKKYFKHGTAQPFKIVNTKYYITKSHSLKQSVPNFRTFELFVTSKDLLNDNGILLKSLRPHFYYHNDQSKIKKICGVNVPPMDSIWGYKMWFPEGGYNLVRLRAISWGPQNIIVSATIRQVDKIIIYNRITPKEASSDIFFSKDLDSDIMFLNKENLKKCCGDNKYFLELIDKEKDLYASKYIGGQYKYKVVDLYKKSLGVQ